MKLFPRRLVMKSTPAAVVGAGVAMGNLTGPAPTPPYPPPAYPSPGATKGMLYDAVESQLRQAVIPKEMAQYEAAQQAYSAMQHYRYMRKSLLTENRMGVDLDIQVLKSVSPQHKAAMQISRNEREREEEKTFFQSLAESLGLTSFLKKRMEEPLGYPGDSAKTVSDRY